MEPGSLASRIIGVAAVALGLLIAAPFLILLGGPLLAVAGTSG
jgi:hypothetical protein